MSRCNVGEGGPLLLGQGDTLKFWQVGSSLVVMGGSSPISALAWDSSQVAAGGSSQIPLGGAPL